MNILFVCLGNICRSPIAAGIMQDVFRTLGIKGTVESAGTANFNVGQPADRRAIEVASSKGINIRNHRARQISRDDFERFDLIIVMEKTHQKSLEAMAPKSVHHKIRRLLPDGDVPDPYFSDEQAFRDVFNQLLPHCQSLGEELIRKRQKP
ncbi:MAG: low molecular weight phosphotyrosine protein phosphatase [Candidatus Obscuribacterales bacterium]|nr:low molecular weight phosphotyrosine protein phosphatase [Candidatus Obscuribacterales bacterium]